jgi:NACalpha-BTF3-like transcription factor
MLKLAPKVGCGINTDESINFCQKSKLYKTKDIQELAKKCGIDITKKSRQELCNEIAKSISSGNFELESPECNEENANKCNTYNRMDINLLAQKCGVSIEGKNSDVCDRIAQAVLNGTYTAQAPASSSSRTPTPTPTPTPIAPKCDTKCKSKDLRADVDLLAKKCGVSTEGNKKQVCDRIAEAVLNGTYAVPAPSSSPTPTPIPSKCDTKCKSKDLRADVDLLAKKCGVSTEGNKKQVCDRIAQAVLNGTYKVSEPSTSSSTPSSPSSSKTKSCVLNPTSVKELNKLSKSELVNALHSCMKQTKSNCLPNMETLPSVDDLVEHYTIEQLKKMCDIKNIKYTNSMSARQLAEALDACACESVYTKPSTPIYTSKSTSKSTSNDDDCFKKHRDKKVTELKELYKKLGIMGAEKTKEALTEYLCSTKKCKNPDWVCEDGLVCDASVANFPDGEGVCIPRDLAEKMIAKTHKYIPPNKQTISTAKNFKKLEEILKKSTQLSESPDSDDSISTSDLFGKSDSEENVNHIDRANYEQEMQHHMNPLPYDEFIKQKAEVSTPQRPEIPEFKRRPPPPVVPESSDSDDSSDSSESDSDDSQSTSDLFRKLDSPRPEIPAIKRRPPLSIPEIPEFKRRPPPPVVPESPPLMQKVSSPPLMQKVPSPPVRRSPSPPLMQKVPSPPVRRSPSPPLIQKVPSPPVRRSPSPPVRR